MNMERAGVQPWQLGKPEEKPALESLVAAKRSDLAGSPDDLNTFNQELQKLHDLYQVRIQAALKREGETQEEVNRWYEGEIHFLCQ